MSSETLSRPEEFCLVFVTCENVDQALKVAEALVEKRLAGCVSVLTDVFSVYRWKGKVEKAEEVLLMIKTRTPLFTEVEREVKKLHSYTTPEIVGFRFDEAFQRYIRWLREETTSKPSK
ncbi:MAG: divalent-cation tolerance protein CutA [Candidatus Bathyarchaeia archaeon]